MIALQVVEVLSGAGLTPSTMRNLLIVLSFGFPVALIFGWFFDISKEGVVKTGPLKEGEQLPALKFLDHVLFLYSPFFLLCLWILIVQMKYIIYIALKRNA